MLWTNVVMPLGLMMMDPDLDVQHRFSVKDAPVKVLTICIQWNSFSASWVVLLMVKLEYNKGDGGGRQAYILLNPELIWQAVRIISCLTAKSSLPIISNNGLLQ